MAFFKTHYYGGIKKYQWTAIPLALHGVVIRADGESVRISIGEDAGDTEIGCIGEIQGMQVHARIAQHAACRSEATLVVLQENSQLRNH